MAVSVNATHTHLLIELPEGYDAAKKTSGQLKQAASHAVGAALPSQVWAAGGKPIEVNDSEHHRRVYHYILRHRCEGDWTWAIQRHPNAVVWGEGWEQAQAEDDGG
ncbi:hypothetical protein OT109_05710 [Phycisphaeraceae bacterium D3-23]